MRIPTWLAPSLIVGSLAVLGGCGSRNFKTLELTPSAPATGHFSSIEAGIFQPKCVTCHRPGGSAFDLTTYSSVMRRVRAGNPSGSSLYTAVEAGTMPPTSPSLSDDEVLAIYLWIKNGAPND